MLKIKTAIFAAKNSPPILLLMCITSLDVSGGTQYDMSLDSTTAKETLKTSLSLQTFDSLISTIFPWPPIRSECFCKTVVHT